MGWFVTVEYICSTCTFLSMIKSNKHLNINKTSICPCEMSERQAGGGSRLPLQHQHSKSITVIPWAVHRLLRWLMILHRNISILILDATCCPFLIFLWHRYWILAIIVWSCAEIRHMQIASKTPLLERTKTFFSFQCWWMSSCCQDAFNYPLLNFMLEDSKGFCLCISFDLFLITKSSSDPIYASH